MFDVPEENQELSEVMYETKTWNANGGLIAG